MSIITKNNSRRFVPRIVLLFSFFTAVTIAHAQVASDNNSLAAKEIISVMEKSTTEWNKGNLNAFMNLYAPSATMMMTAGPAGMKEIRELYEKKYFDQGMPKQNLRYGDMNVRLLGKDYALLTGSFTLYGKNLPERSGRYSLVLIHTKHGWQILHDHSG